MYYCEGIEVFISDLVLLFGLVDFGIDLSFLRGVFFILEQEFDIGVYELGHFQFRRADKGDFIAVRGTQGVFSVELVEVVGVIFGVGVWLACQEMQSGFDLLQWGGVHVFPLLS